ncbi:MAG: FAD-dependent oxidoreductase [Streptococcus sp.]
MSQSYINVIGAGLAARKAYQIAQQGIPVKLTKCGGQIYSATQNRQLAELVCSNSLEIL